MLLKKKRASTTDLSNNGDDQNLPEDDLGKLLKFFFISFHFGLWNFKFDGQNYLVSRDDAICCHILYTHSVVSSCF